MFILGIDTGGTYTDGVILDRESHHVLCTAKALTTPHDLAIGIGACMQALQFHRWQDIAMVSLSTTLATNTIVEGKGCRAGLLLLGKRPAGKLPADVCAMVDAQMDIRGNILQRLAPTSLDAALQHLRGRCDAVAISGYASVRNPAHERQAAQAVRESLGVPVVCGHELTGALGFYERTVTAVLNAQLIPVIHGLIKAVQQTMAQLNINASIMVVRGDGSLMQADYAQERPVETILSGPAASVMGAKFLSGCKDCLVVDMGGTTTDIAHLHAGECTISDEGAQIAGWQTKVRALQICTFGLGGDSKIQTDNTVKIGPQRVIPLCRGSAVQGDTGLTPTDILHVTGEYQQWDTMRAKAGLQQAADKLGLDTAQQAAQALKEKTEIQLAAYCQQGMRAFGAKEIPMLLGVGAPAQTWLPEAAVWLGIPAEIPPFAEVANAVGAATGQIRETAHAFIRPNKLTQEYMLYTEEGRHTVPTLEEAQQKGFALARQLAAQKAKRAGAKQFETKTASQVSCDASGVLIEQRIQVFAYGYPR